MRKYRKTRLITKILGIKASAIAARLAILRKNGEIWESYEDYWKEIQTQLKLAEFLSFKLVDKEAEDIEAFFRAAQKNKEQRLKRAENFLTDLYCSDTPPKATRCFYRNCKKIAKNLGILKDENAYA